MNLKGKRILVTGADSFIESRLVEVVEVLSGQGGDVKSFVFYDFFNSWG